MTGVVERARAILGSALALVAAVVIFVLLAIPQLLRALLRLVLRIAKFIFVLLIGYPRARDGAAAANRPPPKQGADAQSSPLRIAMEVVGAAAGVTVFITFVGGALLWARFHGLGLPADQSVAVLPREILIAVGAGALGPAIILGAVVAFVVGLTKPLGADGQPRFHLAVVLRIFVLAELLILWEVRGLDLYPYVLAGTAVAAFGALAVWGAAVRLRGYRVVGWTLFAVIAITGAVNQYMRTLGTPKMEPAAVLLKEGGEGIAGFYVGQSSDRLYIAPLTDARRAAIGEDIGGVLEISRDQVDRLEIDELTALGTGDPGRAEALALLEELKVPQGSASREAVRGTEPIPADEVRESVAPLVHLHDDDSYRPMSADFLLAHSQLRWAKAPDCEGEDPTLAEGPDVTDEDRADVQPLKAKRLGSVLHPYRYLARCTTKTPELYRSSQLTRPHHDSDLRVQGLNPNEGFYLDISGTTITDDVVTVEHFGTRATFSGPPVYVEEVPGSLPDQLPSEDPKGLRIIYWFLYANSVPPGPEQFRPRIAHEGDWERISVLLDPLGGGPADQASEYMPISARFHVHEDSADVPWDEIELAPDDPVAADDPGSTVGDPAEGDLPPTHPVAYSAQGSHATYPVPGKHDSILPIGKRDAFTARDDTLACGECPLWSTWLGPLISAKEASWYGFGGAWGRAGSKAGFTGPLGPSRYKLTEREREGFPGAEARTP